jgi:hypothetical protein
MSVPGDGACFFHSLAHICLLEEGQKITSTLREKKSRLLRKQCVEWLRNNLDYRIKNIGLTIRDEIEEDIRNNDKIKTIDQYLQYMKKNSSYAGQIEIYAMANILNRSIRVYIHNKGKFNNVGLGYEIHDKKDIMKDLFIYHNLGKQKTKGLHHFEPLYPKVKSSGSVKESKSTKKTTKKKKKTTKKKQQPKRKKQPTKRKKQQTKRKKPVSRRGSKRVRDITARSI